MWIMIDAVSKNWAYSDVNLNTPTYIYDDDFVNDQ